MSKYIYIANSVNNGKVNFCWADTAEASASGKVHLGKPQMYDVQSEAVSLSAATAELSLIEALLARFAKEGVKGRVGISCHRGLALKIAAKKAGKEIWQSFMETAEGDWGSYISRIEELVADAKQVGMELYPIPARSLYTSELTFDQSDVEVIDQKTIKIGETEIKDGMDVEFAEVEGDDFMRSALDCLFANDSFVTGKRQLQVRVGKKGIAHVTVRRFGYDKASDVLPDSVYGEAVSWLRFVAVPALNALEERDGMAPGKAAVSAA